MQTGQVFVSHTSDMAQFPEGRSFVQAALDAVSRAGMAPVDMRYFAARDGKPADYCRQRVRECEIYVAVIGFRYGSVVAGEAVSYTELEFDAASTASLPRLVFLLDGTAGPLAALADADRGAVEGFRQRLRDAGLVVRAFASAADLELEVFHALTEVTGGGLAVVPGTAPSALAVRYSLPPDTAAFTGRVRRDSGDPRDRRDARDREDRAGRACRPPVERPVPGPAAFHQPARPHSGARIRWRRRRRWPDC